MHFPPAKSQAMDLFNFKLIIGEHISSKIMKGNISNVGVHTSQLVRINIKKKKKKKRKRACHEVDGHAS